LQIIFSVFVTKDSLTALVEAATLQQTTASTASEDQYDNEGQNHPRPPVKTAVSEGLNERISVAVGDELSALVVGDTVAPVDLVNEIGDLVFNVLNHLLLFRSLSLYSV